MVPGAAFGQNVAPIGEGETDGKRAIASQVHRFTSECYVGIGSCLAMHDQLRIDLERQLFAPFIGHGSGPRAKPGFHGIPHRPMELLLENLLQFDVSIGIGISAAHGVNTVKIFGYLGPVAVERISRPRLRSTHAITTCE